MAQQGNKGMKNRNTRRGFTLIELLVVVLIIGILAAVALPQYQKAVERSRAAEVYTLLASMYPAQQLYFLNHGSFAKDLKKLDVQFPYDDGGEDNLFFEGGGYRWGKSSDATSLYAIRPYKGGKYGFAIYYTTTAEYDKPIYAGEITCIADQDGKALDMCSSKGYTELYATSESQKLNYYKQAR